MNRVGEVDGKGESALLGTGSEVEEKDAVHTSYGRIYDMALQYHEITTTQVQRNEVSA